MDIIKKGKIKNHDELEFAVFCIENVAIRSGVSAEKVYQALAHESDILYDYIIPNYGALHTQSKEYIVVDILEMLKARGVKI